MRKSGGSRDIWRAGTLHPLVPIPLRARGTALWNFCGTAFFNWCNSNQPAAWRARKTFRRLPRRVPRYSKFRLHSRRRSLVRSHHGKTLTARALLGRIKLPRKRSRIMPVLRRVTLSSYNLARGKSRERPNDDIAHADASWSPWKLIRSTYLRPIVITLIPRARTCLSL